MKNQYPPSDEGPVTDAARLALRSEVALAALHGFAAFRGQLTTDQRLAPWGWCLYLAALAMREGQRRGVPLVLQAGSASWPRLPLDQMPG